MNIFASDLDQTLIYSSRWIGDVVEEVINIEKINDKEISYVLKSTLDEIDKITRNDYFIPVTTRTLEQYRRIDFSGIDITHAVVANGGVILNNGVVDKEWESIITAELKTVSLYKDVLEVLKILELEKGFVKIKDADGLFIYLIIDEDIFNKDCLDKFRGCFDGWSMYDQGRKVYFVPDVIQKGRALKYLKDKINPNLVISSGDSLLDESLIGVSDVFLSPGHSKLKSDIELNDIGICNGYEISNNARKILDGETDNNNF